MDFVRMVEDVLRQTGPGLRISPCAYDTGWVARLGQIHPQLGQTALEWLRANQLDDGTWGVSAPVYYHDRLICTLSAMAALAQFGEAEDGVRLQRAQAALPNLIPALSQDLAGATVGFEMLVPRLISEIVGANVTVTVDAQWAQKLARKRQAKLSMLPQGRINRYVSLSHSLEMLDEHNIKLLDEENLLEGNGSVGCSPAATAFWAKITKRPLTAALEYLQDSLLDEGRGIPFVVPIDVFETSWVLWNLALPKIDLQPWQAVYEPLLNLMERTWKPGLGLAGMSFFSCYDGDTTGLVHATMALYGRHLDLDGVFHYEANEHFITYPLEANPGISTNVHVLEALLNAGLPKEHPSIQKIIRFLGNSRLDRTYWFDKWHVSPYYTTAHAVITCAGCAPEVAAPAVEWLLESQRPEGSWGFFVDATAEETAYCLQALTVWRRTRRGVVSLDVLKRGADWLEANMHLPPAPMWLGKGLYCPEVIVESAVVSALILVSQET